MAASLQDRLTVASALILQSPPGEVNDVFNDLRPIVGDDSELERGLIPALAQYNTEQLTLVELPNEKMPVRSQSPDSQTQTGAMICAAARVSSEEGDRFLDPHSQKTFAFDHLRLAASHLAPFSPPNPDQEETRAELDQLAETYVKNHYQNAVWKVFSIPHQLPDPSVSPPLFASHPNPSLEDPTGDPETPLDPDNAPALEPPTEPSTEHQTHQADHENQNPSSPSSSSSSQKFKLYIVGNKYNPTNYWSVPFPVLCLAVCLNWNMLYRTGRWRSIYEIDMDAGKVQGEIEVNVHYYEQGNVSFFLLDFIRIHKKRKGVEAEKKDAQVQLSTNHQPMIEISGEESSNKKRGAKEVVEAIQKAESSYQAALNNAYSHLGDDTFKLLRRALPVTKQKVNWNNLKSRIVLDDH
ncbi:uncharacterized protein VP01_2201g3 [Puccinia sorghi]|uniref:F-actin-capping protein subunit alpha n=1 Tax=Puccinia sorghi TaxID=27349 RepID=A0A0L6V8V7_9BASI|nr:uncharacterized protein VP01_2201g3 [Puccinia sorghi]